MQWIKNLKLMPKLMLAFGVVLVLMLVQGLTAYSGLNSLNHVTKNLSNTVVPSVRIGGEMRGILGDYRSAAYQSLIRSSDAVKKESQARKIALKKQMDEIIAKYPNKIGTTQERAAYERLVTDWKKRSSPMAPWTKCCSSTCATTRSTPSLARPAFWTIRWWMT